MADYLALAMRDAGRIELRHQDGGRWRCGLFDDLLLLREAVDRLAGSGNLYATLNAPRIMAAPNTLTGAALRDDDIAHVVRLPFDFDPVRPRGVASTDAELAAALTARDGCIAALSGLGWPAPATAISGNGAHALYRCRLRAGEVTAAALRAVYHGLREDFSTGEVVFDSTVCNASRIWRLYGTTNRKGEATPERPHRVASIDIPSRWDAVAPRKLSNWRTCTVAASGAPPRGYRRRGDRARQRVAAIIRRWTRRLVCRARRVQAANRQQQTRRHLPMGRRAFDRRRPARNRHRDLGSGPAVVAAVSLLPCALRRPHHSRRPGALGRRRRPLRNEVGEAVMLALRPYQIETVDAVGAAWARTPRVIVALPTGSGKTEIASHLIDRELAGGGRALVLVERKNLCHQWRRRLLDHGFDHVGVIQAGNTVAMYAPAVIGTIQSVRAHGVPKRISLIVIDESHIWFQGHDAVLAGAGDDVRVLGQPRRRCAKGWACGSVPSWSAPPFAD